jgi:hypothetical protein
MQDWELNQIKAVGAQLVRLDYWEPAKADAVIAKARARGLEPELVIGATLKPTSTTLADFRSRCAAAATKYHGIIRYYEPSNEPDSNGWTGTAYAPFQIACYDAIKAVDSRNVVLMAGLNTAPTNQFTAYWLRDAYAAGLKGHYDVMNVHPYGDPTLNNNWSLWCKTWGCSAMPHPWIIDVMSENGDGGKPIVATEAGGNAASGEAWQASVVGAALRDPRPRQVYIYDMLNTVASYGMMVPDSAGTIVAPDGTHWRRRPAFAAMQSVTGGTG